MKIVSVGEEGVKLFRCLGLLACSYKEIGTMASKGQECPLCGRPIQSYTVVRVEPKEEL